jgi:hypothetical protein
MGVVVHDSTAGVVRTAAHRPERRRYVPSGPASRNLFDVQQRISYRTDSLPSRRGKCYGSAMAYAGELGMGMLVRRCSLLLATLALAGCGQVGGSGEPRPLAPAQAGAVEAGVRAFAETVAHDVTRDGPLAWQKHFGDSPAFFMAVNGQMAFADRAAAAAALPGIARAFKHIDLKWGQDLRVDPLTASLALVATSWEEVLVDASDHTMDQKGYFTGIAEYRDGRWQFRDAHWSTVPQSPAP